MSASSQARSYPLARRVLAADVQGGKRKRVLAVIAAYHDECHAPSITEIATRAKIAGASRNARARMTLGLIRRLEADGLLRVEWASPPARNGYEIMFTELCT